MPDDFEIWIVHPEDEVCDIYRDRFDALTGWRTVPRWFEETPPHDCFVTAGNSFGMMTAGIDAAVVAKFGTQIMRVVQYEILDAYLGEQPVGTAFVVGSGADDVPYLCHAPTMRMPGSIDGSDKVYAATWASLLAIRKFNREHDGVIRTAAFPAMGCGFGAVSYSESARQMAAAYRHFLEPATHLDWDVAIDRHKRIRYDGDEQVVRY